MKYFLIVPSLMIFMIFNLIPGVKAQDTTDIISKKKKNVIGVYVGLIEVNLNYERKIIQRAKSSGSIRLGYGYAMLFVAGEGQYFNAAFVQLFGGRNSHLELNAGVKYMATNSIPDPAFSDQLIPDLFLGYRFEKKSGGVIFRAGINYPTFISAGIGYKF